MASIFVLLFFDFQIHLSSNQSEIVALAICTQLECPSGNSVFQSLKLLRLPQGCTLRPGWLLAIAHASTRLSALVLTKSSTKKCVHYSGGAVIAATVRHASVKFSTTNNAVQRRNDYRLSVAFKNSD